MTEQQYKWQCPICDDVHIDFAPHPLPESLTREIVEEVRKANANSYLMILAERGQHMMNHIMKGEGIGMLGRIKKELEKQEPEEEKEEPKEDLDDNTEQPSVDTPQGQGDDTQEDSESA